MPWLFFCSNVLCHHHHHHHHLLLLSFSFACAQPGGAAGVGLVREAGDLKALRVAVLAVVRVQVRFSRKIRVQLDVHQAPFAAAVDIAELQEHGSSTRRRQRLARVQDVDLATCHVFKTDTKREMRDRRSKSWRIALAPCSDTSMRLSGRNTTDVSTVASLPSSATCESKREEGRQGKKRKKKRKKNNKEGDGRWGSVSVEGRPMLLSKYQK